MSMCGYEVSRLYCPTIPTDFRVLLFIFQFYDSYNMASGRTLLMILISVKRGNKNYCKQKLSVL